MLKPSSRHISVPIAFGTWAAAWLTGQVIASIVYTVGGVEPTSTASVGLTAIATIPTWALYLAGMDWVSRRHGDGSFASDFGVRFRRVDAIGLAVGVATQIIAVPLIYLPLRALWPGTFSGDRVQESASSLVERANGGDAVLLVAMIAIGAPIVEEIVYRGLLQRTLASRLGAITAWVLTAGLFTVIHFRPVEYPGLAVFALVVGAAALLPRRLGFAITVHVGFNAAGLLLAWR